MNWWEVSIYVDGKRVCSEQPEDLRTVRTMPLENATAASQMPSCLHPFPVSMQDEAKSLPPQPLHLLLPPSLLSLPPSLFLPPCPYTHISCFTNCLPTIGDSEEVIQVCATGHGEDKECACAQDNSLNW